MRFKGFLLWLAVATLVVLAQQQFGWAGVAFALGGLVMWLMLHFTRLMHVMRRASARPVGHVDSAVMLNARLKPGTTLLNVIALARALGTRLPDEAQQPERYRWSDASGSSVDCEFERGRLARWTLTRPAQD